MNVADPKWLEILKASGWQTAGLAAAAAALLYLNARRSLDRPAVPCKIGLLLHLLPGARGSGSPEPVGGGKNETEGD